jgi:4-hydroxy-tetrahydrodipicolinate reductase
MSVRRLKIGVVGASGRSGRFVLEALRDHARLEVGAAIVSPQSKVLGQEVGFQGVCYSHNTSELAACDGVIDFSSAESSVAVAAVCHSHRLPLLVAATGHSPSQYEAIRRVGSVAALCIASNTSVGAAVLSLVAEYAQELLGEGFDVELLEIHHKMKRDAPSGTAKSIVHGLLEHCKGGMSIYGRPGLRAEGEVGVASLRGGDVPGDHTVFFFGNSERLELRHSVSDRRVFGHGAVVLIERLLGGCGAGIYSVRELLLASKNQPKSDSKHQK